MKIILKEKASSQWISLENPVQLLAAYRIDQITSLLQTLDQIIDQHRYYVAGFISYEAAPGIDPALTTLSLDSFPLICFGVYQEFTVLLNDYIDMASDPTDLDLEPSVTEEEYHEKIRRIKEFLAAGDTYQVNYTFRLRGKLPPDGMDLFRQLHHIQPSRYSAFIESDDYILCSASPELFLLKEGNLVLSKPMKGTTPRGRYLEEDHHKAAELKNDLKTCAENVMIVDMVRNDLGRIATTGSVHVVSLMDVEKYPTLLQMTSTIECRTAAPWSRIISSTFPAASITGAPKKRTMELIAMLECSPRKIYTGSIGYITPAGDGQFSVAIRSALIDRKQNSIEYGTGGGIVWDSDSSSEYQEALLKAKVLSARRREFELLESIRLNADQGYYLLDYHLDRMSQSAEYFDYKFDRQSTHKQLEQFRCNYRNGTWKIRVLLSKNGKILIEGSPLESQLHQIPERLRYARSPVDSTDPFLFHKTTRREIYLNAKTEVNDCDDVILWNEKGELTETTVANIVVKINGIWLTPPISSGLLPGTFRRLLIKQGRIEERILTRNDLFKAEEIQIINSVRLQIPAVFVKE